MFFTYDDLESVPCKAIYQATCTCIFAWYKVDTVVPLMRTKIVACISHERLQSGLILQFTVAFSHDYKQNVHHTAPFWGSFELGILTIRPGTSPEVLVFRDLYMLPTCCASQGVSWCTSIVDNAEIALTSHVIHCEVVYTSDLILWLCITAGYVYMYIQAML